MATPASMVERAIEAFGSKAQVGFPFRSGTAHCQPLVRTSSGPCAAPLLLNAWEHTEECFCYTLPATAFPCFGRVLWLQHS